MAKKKIQLEAKVDLILKTMDQRFGSIDERFDAIDQKFGAIDQKFGAIDERFGSVDQKFNSLDQKIDDLASVVAHLNCKTNERIDYLASHMQEEFRVVNGKLDCKLDRKEFVTWVHKYDGSLKEIREARQNRLLFENQFVDLDDKVAKHDDRIKKLEQKAKA